MYVLKAFSFQIYPKAELFAERISVPFQSFEFVSDFEYYY